MANGTTTLNILRYRPRSFFGFLSRNKLLIVITIILLAAVAAALLYKASPLTKVSGPILQSNTSQNSVTINREFNFPIYNQGQKTDNALKMVLSTVERSDKILVNGNPASARDGKDFLIIYLEINNPTSDKLNVRPVDFFRLKDESGSLFAADVHNDPVKAEPISIKRTRIGYVVDESQDTFKFLVGEINGEKQELEINI